MSVPTLPFWHEDTTEGPKTLPIQMVMNAGIKLSLLKAFGPPTVPFCVGRELVEAAVYEPMAVAADEPSVVEVVVFYWAAPRAADQGAACRDDGDDGNPETQTRPKPSRRS